MSQIQIEMCYVIILLLCVLREPARGQPVAMIGCETSAACWALVQHAHQQSQAGQFNEAEKSYKLAYELSHDGRLLYNIGRVLDKRGKVEEAKTYYRMFLQAPVEDEGQKKKARGFLEQLEVKRDTASTPEQLEIKRDTSLTPEQLEVKRDTSPTPVVSAPQDNERSATPVYKKGWFWGVMIGSVAAVGLGVGLGIGLQGPTVPNGTNRIAY